MAPFEAICMMMTTVSTAGFANSDLSIGTFDSVWIDDTIIFMIMGHLLLYRFYRNPKTIWRDSQVRVFISLMAIAQWSDDSMAMVDNQYTFWVPSYGALLWFQLLQRQVIPHDFNAWCFALTFSSLMFVGGCRINSGRH